jgi:two-component system OmpR family response regulator
MSDLRVLLVDDEEELVTTLVERLRWRGLQATAVTNGPAALELLRKERYDVVVIDMKMPGMNGLVLRDLIQRDFPAVRVLLATGHGRDSDGDDMDMPQEQDVLLKPFSIDVLIDRINRPPGK